MSAGHEETLAFVDVWLRRLEGDPLPMPDFAAFARGCGRRRAGELANRRPVVRRVPGPAGR